MDLDELQQVRDWLETHKSQQLSVTQELLKIPSIESDPLPNAPFGPENRRALDYMLQLAGDWDLDTKDLEGYGAWAEFGEGERLILIQGHLDVVPVGPGWKYDPFSATIDGEYLYSRGAVDDKGPTVAAFFAARAIMECCPNLNARIRTFFGCNEESGFKCIERYVKTEEIPTFGVAPDAGWPLYHGEKGILNLIVDIDKSGTQMTIVSLAGGQRPNIVIDSAKGSVRVSSASLAAVQEKLGKCWDRNLSYAWDGDILTVEAIGKAAHGSWPHGGDNAATRILRFWREICPLEDQKFYDDLYEIAQISGAGLGIQLSDDISDLTSNLGIVEDKGDKLVFTVNIRYPVTMDGQVIARKCAHFLDGLPHPFELASHVDSKPLYFPLDHPLVRTVVDVYEEETGERRQPGVMGGGTYARAVPNSVAIGTGWGGDGEAHQTDERVRIENLYKMARIYAHILLRLAKV